MSDELGPFIVRSLLHYFQRGSVISAAGGTVGRPEVDMLAMHWSVSDAVARLAEYLQTHPHEVRASLARRTTVESGTIRGRLDAAATVVAQLCSGDPSLFVFDEPFRSHATGPNRVLVWTMRLAARHAERFRAELPAEATYRERVVATLRSVEDCRRVLPWLPPNETAPSANDVRAARTSRLRIYRLAAEAFDLLQALERLDERAIATLLESTLIGPVKRWRQFELALMLAMADGIAAFTGDEPRMEHLLPGALDLAVSVGRYGLSWQKAGPNYTTPALDPWERREAEIITAYGLSPGYERPDLVLIDREVDRTIAVGEAKYFENDDWRDRLRDAVGQVVSYARGYEAKQGDVDDIIGRSIVALWDTAGHALTATVRTPFVATFADLRTGLGTWAARALAGSRSAPPFGGSGSPSSAVASVAGG